jgi:hypothetical protein
MAEKKAKQAKAAAQQAHESTDELLTALVTKGKKNGGTLTYGELSMIYRQSTSPRIRSTRCMTPLAKKASKS